MQGLHPHRYLPCSYFGFKHASFVREADVRRVQTHDRSGDRGPRDDPGAAPRAPAPGSAWLKWLARRLGLAVLTLWLCSVLVFFATAALGDPVRAILGKDYASSPERVAALRPSSSWTSR